jgi:hypothetical protein
VPSRASIDRRQEDQAPGQPVHELAVLGDPVEEVGAHRHHHSQRGRGVVGGAGQAGGERPPLVTIGDQGVQLLELIDEQQDALTLQAGPAAQEGAQVAGLGAQPVDERLVLGHPRRQIDRAAVGERLQQGRQPGQRRAAGASHEDLPGLLRRLERGDDAGPQQRRLADARRADHADQRLVAHLLDQVDDVAAAAEEAIGVGLLEGAEPRIRAVVVVAAAAVAAGLAAVERGQELPGRREALVAVLGDAAVDDALELAGQIGDHAADAGQRLIELGRGRHQLAAGRLGAERMAAGQRLPQHDADRPQVGTLVDVAGAELLGRHVDQGPDQHAVIGDVAGAELDVRAADIVTAGDQLGDAEVEDLDGAGPGHEHVVGLEIAVDDAELVGADEGADHRRHQLDGPPRRQRPAAQQARQRIAFQVLEDQVGLAAPLAGVVDDDDVVVGAAGGGPGLDQEALGQLRRPQAQDLERDQPRQPGVAGQEHPAHAAAAELADDLELGDAGASADVVDRALGTTGDVGPRVPGAAGRGRGLGDRGRFQDRAAVGGLGPDGR